MKFGSLAIAFVLAAAAPATADMTVCVKTDSDCPCGSVTVDATEYCHNYGGCSNLFDVLLCNFDNECEGQACGSPPGSYDQIFKAGIADCTDSIPTDCFDAAGPTPPPPTPAPPTPTAPTDMPTSAGTNLFNAVPLVVGTVSYLVLLN